MGFDEFVRLICPRNGSMVESILIHSKYPILRDKLMIKLKLSPKKPVDIAKFQRWISPLLRYGILEGNKLNGEYYYQVSDMIRQWLNNVWYDYKRRFLK